MGTGSSIALPGLVIIIAAYIATILVWMHVRNTRETLGKGVMTKVINWILVAEAFFVLHSAFKVLFIYFGDVRYNILSDFFQIIIPFVLLYAVWMVSNYTDKLKKMAG